MIASMGCNKEGGEMSNAYKTLVGKPEEKYDMEDASVEDTIILKYIFGKYIWLEEVY